MIYDDDMGAFYKAADGKLEGARVIRGRGWVLDWNSPTRETDTHDGWRWFDSEAEAYFYYGIPIEYVDDHAG